MTDVSSEEGFEQIFAALFSATGAVAAQLPAVAGSPEFQGGIAVVLPALGWAIGKGVHHAFVTRRASFAQGYVNAFEGDPDKAKAHADDNKDNAELNETMFRAFRMMMDAADPSVVPTLGYLAGHYNAAGKAPDTFFRSLGRLLCDLESGDLICLQRLLRAVERCAMEWQVRERILVGVRLSDNGLVVQASDGQVREIGAPGEAVRMFNFLRREGFSLPNYEFMTLADPDQPSGDYALSLSIPTLESILAIIDPRATC